MQGPDSVNGGRNVRLVTPAMEFREAFLAMVEEFGVAGEESHQAVRSLANEGFARYVQKLIDGARTSDLPPGLVPQTTFWLVREGTLIGTSRLRHYLTPDLEVEGGNIGYDIRPSERRKGYGTLLLALTLKEAHKLGLSRVLVTCDKDNVGSARIIEKNGGRLDGEGISPESGKVVSRYWIDLDNR